MDVAFCVVTIPFHPKRMKVVERFMGILPEPKFVQCDYPPPRNSLRDNHLTAWAKLYDTGKKWLCLVQDDIVWTPDFMVLLGEVIEKAEESGAGIVPLFNIGFSNQDSEGRDSEQVLRWIKELGHKFVLLERHDMSDVAMLVRRDFIFQYLKFVEDLQKSGEWYTDQLYSNPRAHDAIFSRFMKLNKFNSYVVYPNIIGHSTDFKSTVGHGWKNSFGIRMSYSFLGSQGDRDDRFSKK